MHVYCTIKGPKCCVVLEGSPRHRGGTVVQFAQVRLVIIIIVSVVLIPFVHTNDVCMARQRLIQKFKAISKVDRWKLLAPHIGLGERDIEDCRSYQEQRLHGLT